MGCVVGRAVLPCLEELALEAEGVWGVLGVEFSKGSCGVLGTWVREGVFRQP